MRTIIVTTVVFLLAGAVVNVAVAWGLVVRETRSLQNRPVRRFILFHEDGRGHFAGIFSDLARTTIRYYDKGEMTLYQVDWKVGEIENSTGHQRDSIRRELDLPSWSFADRVRRGDNSSDFTEAHDHVAGWPMRSLRCQMLYLPSGSVWGVWEDRPFVRYGLLLPQRQNWWPEYRALPVYPIWTGFTINTIFYAAVLWLLIPGPFVLRRQIRVWQGFCPKCAYPVGESTVCSECGRAAKSVGTRDAH